jgi:hypothetical protein
MSDTTITVPWAFSLVAPDKIECLTCKQIHAISDFFWEIRKAGENKIKMRCPSCGATSSKNLGCLIRNFLIGATMPYWREG